jgi:hypothetical protein
MMTHLTSLGSVLRPVEVEPETEKVLVHSAVRLLDRVEAEAELQVVDLPVACLADSPARMAGLEVRLAATPGFDVNG